MRERFMPPTYKRIGGEASTFNVLSGLAVILKAHRVPADLKIVSR